MLGQKIRELREAMGLVQREVAAKLEVDVAYVCKMESNDKPVSRHHLKKLAQLLGAREEELHTLWVADKLYGIAKNEADGLKALELVGGVLKSQAKRKA